MMTVREVESDNERLSSEEVSDERVSREERIQLASDNERLSREVKR
jgi:hypothetical protein